MHSRLLILSHISFALLTAVTIGFFSLPSAGEPAPLNISFLPQNNIRFAEKDSKTAKVTLTFPGKVSLPLQISPADAFNLGSVSLKITLPDNSPTNTIFMAHVIDRDQKWFQNTSNSYLAAGTTNTLTIPFSPDSRNWRPHGHHGGWNARTMLNPNETAFNLYSDRPYTGICEIAISDITSFTDTTPPVIQAVRPFNRSIGTFSRYELRLSLPDRYRDPFDRETVHLTATFTGTNTQPVTVDGFYYQNYYRTASTTGEIITPRGHPEWRVRYCPTKPGIYTCRLNVTDSFGTASYPPLTFTVTNSNARGFARVSKKDPRYFETSDDQFFFPIGHNIRSPFDTRMDKQFPWRNRRKEGSLVYKKYFKDMKAHHENMAEVWSCAWSLGLEWTPRDHGYHGVGDYNMIHAWELDHLLVMAENHEIFINLVLNNHGRLSTFCDPEWDDNPYNTANGGYLNDPMSFFDNPRAIRDTEKLYRYMIARYGAYSNIFAWELWSELDLIGPGARMPKPHHQQRVVDWHDRFGTFFKANDPYTHLVATHVCGDYTHQNPAIVRIPTMTHAPVDAYHSSSSPIYIASLINKTAEFNAPFNKPVIITEFGGSPHANTKHFLSQELHCALWSSVCGGLASTPLFWWWQLIEEAGFYPKYTAIHTFIDGMDLRDPELKKSVLTIQAPDSPYPLSTVYMSSQNMALGWVYSRERTTWTSTKEPSTVKTSSTTIRRLKDGIYRITFTDTATGETAHCYEERSRNGAMNITFPPFKRDIAFKISPKQ